FSTGIHWLIEQVELLEDHLQTRTSLQPHQRLLAIRLSGRDPRDLFTDRLVKQWNGDYLSALHGPGKISASEAAELVQDDRPPALPLDEFEWILGEWLTELDSIPEGQALLKQSLAELKAELQERLKVVAAREAVDRALALDQAKVSVDDECMRYSRY